SSDYGDGHDYGFQDESPDDPAENRKLGVALRTSGEELLVHALIAEQQKHGGDQQFHSAHKASPGALIYAVDYRKATEDLEVLRRQSCMHRAPPACLSQEERDRSDTGNGRQRANDHVQIGNRAHSGESSEQNDKASDDDHPQCRLVAGGDMEGIPGNVIQAGEDQPQHVAAASKLVGSDGGKSEEDGDGSQHAGRGVVTGLQQIRNREL